MSYHSKIYVQYKSGSKAEGKKVVLAFGGLGGMTKTFYTDRDGIAIIEHHSTGRAKIYVSGAEVGEFSAPGETVVFIS